MSVVKTNLNPLLMLPLVEKTTIVITVIVAAIIAAEWVRSGVLDLET